MGLAFHFEETSLFPSSVHDQHFTLKILPPSDERQRITRCEYSVAPACHLSYDTDAFSNQVIYGAVREEHESFTVKAEGEAEIDEAAYVSAMGPLSSLFLTESRMTIPGDNLLALKGKCRSFPDPIDTAFSFTEEIHRIFSYQKGITTMDSTAEEALSLRAGVCQDFAQILISLLRLEGIQVRYVCGMVEGEGESHAWTEIARDGVYIPFDPTRSCLAKSGYIRISSGRDSQDTLLIRGVYKGRAGERASTSFKVGEECR